jgi:tetratricopeptide (TPR) repeat protein
MWEDVTMLRDARRVEIAEQEVNGADNPQTRAALADAIKERDRVETDIFLSRCKREPESPEIQYQLGMRLMRAERFDEACQFFEKAQASRDHRAAAELRLGECFEKRGDVAGALHHYRASAEAAMGTYRIEEQKESLYRAGKLALRIKLAILAERYLVQLLRIDPSHREAAVLMQRI